MYVRITNQIVETTQQGGSPLYIASQQGNLEVVQVLLEYGASVNLVNDVSCFFFLTTVYSSHLMYVLASDFVNLQDEQHDSALIIACQYGYSAIARVLLDQGATINYQNQVRSLCNVHNSIL